LPIPTYDALMLPVLRHCADKAWTMRELVARISDDLGLTLEERAQQIPSGGSLLVSNRWTRHGCPQSQYRGTVHTIMGAAALNGGNVSLGARIENSFGGTTPRTQAVGATAALGRNRPFRTRDQVTAA
jgi:restriction endonuclease Mrr